MAEVELVQNAVYGVAREQGHVIQLRATPPPVAAAPDESNSRTAGLESMPAGRPSFETKGSEQSGRTVVPPPAEQPPAMPTRPAGLPFEGRASSPHRGHAAAGDHSVRSSASSSQRPVPATLVIPSSSAERDLHPRDQAFARLAGGERRQEGRPDATADDEADDDRPLAHRLVKLQQRDSSPAVLRSPTLGGPSAAGTNEERQQQQQARPPQAVDQPPPLPAKSQSFSIPASRTYQQQQQHLSPSHPSPGWPSGGRPSHPSAEGAPRDPYEVLSRPMPKELDTSAQMKEKLMRSMTGFGKARKSAKSKMEQVRLAHPSFVALWESIFADRMPALRLDASSWSGRRRRTQPACRRLALDGSSSRRPQVDLDALASPPPPPPIGHAREPVREPARPAACPFALAQRRNGQQRRDRRRLDACQR